MRPTGYWRPEGYWEPLIGSYLRLAEEALLFEVSRRKTAKVVPYKMGSGAALGAFRVLVGRH